MAGRPLRVRAWAFLESRILLQIQAQVEGAKKKKRCTGWSEKEPTVLFYPSGVEVNVCLDNRLPGIMDPIDRFKRFFLLGKVKSEAYCKKNFCAGAKEFGGPFTDGRRSFCVELVLILRALLTGRQDRCDFCAFPRHRQ